MVFSDWIYRALNFLVVSFPCALIISVPFVFWGGIGGTAKQGILMKGSNYPEALSHTDVFSMLCDSTRLRILWLFCHTEECVSDIATAVGKEVLYTLAKTKEASLVHNMIDDIFEINCPR